jgi:hypothetical protein
VHHMVCLMLPVLRHTQVLSQGVAVEELLGTMHLHLHLACR